MDLCRQISTELIEGDLKGVTKRTKQALAVGMPAKEVLDSALIPAMEDVGAAMKRGDMFIPEVLLAAHAMSAAIDILKPELVACGVRMRGRVVLGTVKGDVHNIGLNLVATMLQGAGFEVFSLGTDVSPEAFVDAIEREKPDVVGMSALLSTTMLMMRTTLDVMREAGIRERVKVMVGGAPVTQEFAEQIGADGFGADAVAAVDLAKAFVSS